MKTLKDYISFPGLYSVRGNKEETENSIGNIHHQGVVLITNSGLAYCVTNLEHYEDYKIGCQVFKHEDYFAESLTNILVTGEIRTIAVRKFSSELEF